MDEIIANMTTPELLIAIRDEAHAGRTESLYVHKKTWPAVCELLNVRCTRIERFASGLRDRLGIEDDVLASTNRTRRQTWIKQCHRFLRYVTFLRAPHVRP